MKETIKTLILDFQETDLQTGTPRHLNIETSKGKATVFIGVRRSGKSTYIYQTIEQLLERGISRENILYLNFFDDRLHELQHSGLGVILDAYYSLYPEKKNTETVYFFFDEIQVIPEWESFVERLMRTEKSQVWITGSSAQMLSQEIATRMRGRALAWEIFPFSFREFLDFKKINANKPMSTKKRLLVQEAFEDYWQNGGFPEVAATSKALRIKIHQEYFNTLLFRDLIERHDIAHPKAVSDLAHWLVNNNASLYSLSRLNGYLKSLGHKTPRSALANYLQWFEDAYFLFTLRIFDASLARQNTNPKKIYCIDHSLVTSVSSGVLVNSGHLLENLVFTALRRVYPKLYYYKTRKGREVDFVAPLRDGSRILVQVCETMAAPTTREREVRALSEAMSESGVRSATIVTRDEKEEILIDDKTIQVLPAWEFLLTLPEMQIEN